MQAAERMGQARQIYIDLDNVVGALNRLKARIGAPDSAFQDDKHGKLVIEACEEFLNKDGLSHAHSHFHEQSSVF